MLTWNVKLFDAWKKSLHPLVTILSLEIFSLSWLFVYDRLIIRISPGTWWNIPAHFLALLDNLFTSNMERKLLTSSFLAGNQWGWIATFFVRSEESVLWTLMLLKFDESIADIVCNVFLSCKILGYRGSALLF